MNDPNIHHLIVLMLENRSFDHMLGYLEYPPDVDFEGVQSRESEMGNPLINGNFVFPGPNASYQIQTEPDHSHEGVMEQLLGSFDRTRPYQLKNNGFAANFEARSPGNGAEVLQCFTPERLPVLATLAKQFAVCDHWFCSVPGATWPNRNFAHAATSDGEVNIRLRSYTNKTIFEQLSEGKRDWAIYYGGFPPQSLAFTGLWNQPDQNWLQRFKPISNLYRAIEHDHLPHYAFVEPDMLGKTSDSQHPGTGGEMDFRAAERLIWRIYNSLRKNMHVFKKTLFLITYDEHGGFFDHVPPPQGQEWSVQPPYQEESSSYAFEFDLLGPRVPAVLISPWIAPETVDHTIFDHVSIPATVRKLFQLPAPPLTSREARANTFESVLNLDAPREQLPLLEEPFVDESVRTLAEGLELRESLSWILSNLIWEEAIKTARARPDSALFGGMAYSFAIGSEPDLAMDVNQQILDEIGPQLSPEARQVLDEMEALPAMDPDAGALSFSGPFEDLVGGAGRFVSIVRSKVARLLENSTLVDDAMIVADWFLRKFEHHNIILRTAEDFSIEQPDEKTLRTALEALFVQTQPDARVWLSDYLDRWLTVYADGCCTFQDREPEALFLIENGNLESSLKLFEDLRRGDVVAVRKAFE